jgi:hypothetical protein
MSDAELLIVLCVAALLIVATFLQFASAKET